MTVGGYEVKECACRQPAPDGSVALESFARVRSRCPALRQLLVPDDLWPEFAQWHREIDDVAWHRSSLLLAWERGTLGRVISAVHRFLIRDGQLRQETVAQYRQDLRETWMLASEPTQRHRRSRAFAGKLAELQFGEWLEAQGWAVSGLEAIGAKTDIEASSSENPATAALEVKLIGVEDADFAAIVRSLANQPSVHWVSPYDAANYLVFRAYEAACQLRHVESRRIAVVAIEELTWHRFAPQIDGGWIDWEHPSFFDRTSGATGEWEFFLESRNSQHPDLPGDLAQTLRRLDELWILVRSEGHRYRLHKTLPNHNM